MNVATAQTTEVARPLRVLVPLIKEELQAGDSAGLEHYRRAGEMLIEAKDQMDRSEWKGWLDRNFHLSYATATRYVRLASQGENRRRFSTLSEAVDPPRAHHQTTWHQPVREIASRVNVEALTKDRQNREREAQMLRKLSHQLIDIGYKVLASKLHPDKGGSAEAMARLNKVRATLKGAI
jgi:hypothetical protein